MAIGASSATTGGEQLTRVGGTEECRNATLPPMRRGDVRAVPDADMYPETLSTQMNGVPRPGTALLDDGQAELIKEQETVSDVFAF